MTRSSPPLNSSGPPMVDGSQFYLPPGPRTRASVRPSTSRAPCVHLPRGGSFSLSLCHWVYSPPCSWKDRRTPVSCARRSPLARCPGSRTEPRAGADHIHPPWPLPTLHVPRARLSSSSPPLPWHLPSSWGDTIPPPAVPWFSPGGSGEPRTHVLLSSTQLIGPGAWACFSR